MADSDTRIFHSISVHPNDGAPAVDRLVAPNVNTIRIQYGDLTVFLTDLGLDRLTDAISTFRASEAQAEAA